MERTKKRERTGFRKWLHEFLTGTYTYRKGDGPLVTVVGHRYFSVDPREVFEVLARRGELDGMPGFSKKSTGENSDSHSSGPKERKENPGTEHGA